MTYVNRLIEYFKPNNYKLTIDLNRADRSFTGVVTISGETQGDGSKIGFHSKDLTLENIKLDGESVDWEVAENDEVYIATKNQQARTEVEISFSGKITDKMNGIYPCYYQHDGQNKELLATQFESHYAREAFPCIDEPEAKATFDVTLTTEKDIQVIGNMPAIEQAIADDKLTTTFDTTPKMSTYLLAWVTGELHKKTAYTKSGVEVSVWATPAQPADSLSFGLDIATRTIDFFEDYFQTPYPLPKSDNVALPDFSSGAMENWGLVTYRETALLADPKTTSSTDKHQAATVITHELSHQWFGNLVTMKWWNDLWLNESFASMMENVAVDALEPSWNIWLMDATSGTPSALQRDSLNGVQAVRSDVNHPDEIQTLFDPSIVYAKGARLLLMLQKYLGEDAMRRGLQSYFAEFAYQNTVAEDLWKHLSKVSGKDVGGFMNDWINKPGYPVVNVSREDDTVTVSQKRFYIGDHQATDETWPIPLRASLEELPELLDSKSLSVKTSDDFVYLNSGATGHFITNYDQLTLKVILQNIQSLDTIDRLYFLQERMLLAKAGVISTADLVPLLETHKEETDNSVWDMLAAIVAELKSFIEPDSDEDRSLREIVDKLTEKEYLRLGWDSQQDEPESDSKQRATIIGLKLYAENSQAVDTALKIYGNVALKDDIAVGLTATKNLQTISRLAETSKDTSIVRLQDFTYWFVRLLRNRYGRDYMWKWAQDNWQWMTETFSGDSNYDLLPRYIAGSLNKKQHLDEYSNFFKPLESDLALKRNIQLGVHELKAKVDLISRDSEAVSKALVEHRK